MKREIRKNVFNQVQVNGSKARRASRQATQWAAAIATGLFAGSAQAANTTNNYTGVATGNVTTTSNWSLSHVPTVTEDAVFPIAAATGIRNYGTGATPSLTNITVGSLNNLSTGTTITLRNQTSSTSAVTLTLGGVGNLGNGISGTAADLIYVVSGGTLNIDGPGTGSDTLGLVLGQSGNFNIEGTSTISSVISDGGSGYGITKTGAGTLTLSGANTYTGGTAISAGTLKVGNATALGGNAGAVTVTSGAVLDLNGTTMTGTNALTLNGTGISSGGALTNSSATAGTYAGLVTLGSVSSIVSNSGNIILSNTGTITGSGFGLTLDGSAAGSSIASIIGTGAGTVTKQGSGTWTLSGANTYTGATAINAGMLTLSGSINSGALALGGGTLNYTATAGSTQTFASTAVNAGNSTVTNGTATNIVNLATITRSGNGLLNISSLTGTTNTSNVIDSTGILGTWVSTGTGTGLTYAAGGSGGAITAYTGTAAATAANVTSTTGTVNYDVAAVGALGAGASFNTLRYTGGAGTITGGFTANGLMNAGTGTLVYSGGVTIGASKELVIVGNTQGTTLSGVISNNGGGASSITYGGPSAGILTLSNANSYSGGTMFNAGTLLFGNDSAFGTGTVTLNAGTLKNNAAGNRILANNIAVGGASILDMAGKNLDLNGNLSGSAALTLTNSGAASTLALNGTNSGYSGTITFNNNNAVSFNSANAGSAAAAWVFNDANGDRVRINVGNNTLNFGSIAGAGQMQNDTAGTTSTISVGALNTSTTFSGTIKDNGTGILALTKVGIGTLSLTGGNTYSGGTTISAGTVALTTNNTVFGTGSVAIGTSGTVNITFSGDAPIANVFTGTGTITVAGSAGTPTFSNASGLNGFTGTLNVNTTGGKKVVVNAAGEKIGSGATVNITTGGTLYLNTTTASFDGVTFNVVGSGNTENLGAIRIESGSVIGATSSVVLGGNTSLGSNSGTGTINAIISESTASAVTKVGGGIFVLGGANSYTAGTTISAGTLQFAKLVSMPASGAVTANTGSTLAVNLGGTGEWTTGTSGNGTVGGLLSGLGGQSGGTVTWSGAVNLGLDTTNAGSAQTYSGNIGNVGTSLGINKLGTGTLALSGTNNTYTGQTTVSGGTLNYNGTLSSGAQINVGVAGGGNAVMNLQTGSNITLNPSGTNNIVVGAGTTSTTGQGFLYQSGGAIVGSTGGTSPYSNLQLGGGASGSSYGYYNLSGGTASVSEADIGGFNAAATGVLDLSGTGTLNAGANGGWMIVERSQAGGGIGILNMTGGTLNYTGAAGHFLNNWGTAGTGTAVINVANATLTALSADISLNAGSNGSNGSASNFGEINLLTGGTLQAHSIIGGTAAGTRIVNFNGGTLKASTTNATFLNTLSAVNVFGNGGTIDNNGVAITIPVALLAASGSGVSSVAITSGGSGYLGAPAITFSGGGGTGAAGYATVAGGVITGIVITNPGTGYTSAPTITLTGGGSTNASIGTISTAANTSGGMIFQGSGTTTLSVANSYTGITSVQAGTLALSGTTNNIASSSKIIVGDTAAHSTAGLNVTGLSSGFTLGTNQTLGGYGTVTGNVTGSSTSTVAPGNSNGKLTINGNFTLSTGGKLNIQLDKTVTTQFTAPSDQSISGVQQYDQLAVSTGKTVTLIGGILALEFGQNLKIGDVYYILDNQGNQTSVSEGTFASATINGAAASGTMADNTTFSATVGGSVYSFLINYTGNVTGSDNNDVFLTAQAVPEPTSLAVLGLASAALLGRRRREKQSSR